ncbi:F-box domain-containing protein [Mycena indigotica]|uniref:F-box domain-containing protein n=1 Tax=Mycena indigotica TaxID=2126181 RepID=A0A8H6SZL6_9AGAR|nr:F-box domain-containing protein [Mycena indigotica]KAF7307571.1 F-box domain-containing protein [Mycena indigotica]
MRATWLEAAKPGEKDYSHPRFLSVLLPSETEVSPNNPLQEWELVPTGDPAIWALPQIAVDDTLGLTVVGNCLGELGVYDFGRGNVFPSNIFKQVADPDVPLLGQILSKAPLELTPIKGPEATMSGEEFRNAISHWSQDRIVDWHWTNEWYEDRNWVNPHQWCGHPGDLAWMMEHSYGFPGEVLPQAYTPRDEAYTPCTLFRIGDRYLAEDSDGFIVSWSNAVDHGFHVPAAQVELPLCPTARTDDEVFTKSFVVEREDRKRNRWIEQQERGGCSSWGFY